MMIGNQPSCMNQPSNFGLVINAREFDAMIQGRFDATSLPSMYDEFIFELLFAASKSSKNPRHQLPS